MKQHNQHEYQIKLIVHILTKDTSDKEKPLEVKLSASLRMRKEVT